MKAWENKTVDDAGYLVTTSDHIRGAADSLRKISDPSQVDAAMEELFLGDMSVEQVRLEHARKLRHLSEIIASIAEELEHPQVDETGSDGVAYDAAHSVFVGA